MRPYSQIIEQLRAAGLRPTRQRLALAKLLFENAPRHVTAEVLHVEAQAASMPVSLATVYNTLHQFTEAGLLKEIVIDPQRSHFDTTISDHGHFYFEETGHLQDIPSGEATLTQMPVLPEGTKVKSVDVVVRVFNN
ncbi:MAG: transcriptional repressor [Rhodospirillaceae bacterium]|nr:transcriptional repressor [Rhodospirillaceae bacterium]